MPWAWLVWEIGILLAAVRLVRKAAFDGRSAPASEEYFIVLLAADVVLASTIAAVFSFARLNHPIAYLVTAFLLAAASLLIPGRRRQCGSTVSVIASHPCLFSCLGVLFVPLLLLALRPIQDVDSLNIAHFLIEWMNNRLTPYTFGLNWIPFWELNFLPPLILTRSDLFFGLVALKSIALVGAGLFLVALELEIPRRLAVVLVASVLAFRHFWWEYSGVPTLKTDALHAAGAVLLGLALLRAGRGRRGRAEHILMALGIAFACVKFSGPLIAAFAFLLYTVLARPKRLVLASILAFGVVTSGHYYLRSLITYGNPVYPFAIHIGGLRLPGTAELSNLSILHSLDDERLWRAFFLPGGGLSPAGLLFPVTLAVVLIASMWTALSAAVRRTPRTWFTAFLLAGWFVYFASVYSASSEPGDLAYVLNSLNSLRYVEGVLGLSEVWLTALLLPVSGAAACVAVAISLASRLWMLYRNVPLDVFPVVLVLGVCLAIGVLLFLISAFRPKVLGGVVLLTLLVAGPLVTERNRCHWADSWKDIHLPLRHLQASSIFLVEDPRAGHAAGHYVLAGDRLQHDVRVAAESEMPDPAPRYLVRLINSNEPKPDFEAFAARHAPLGYEPVVRSENGILLERFGSIRSPAVMKAWLLAAGALPRAGAMAAEGSAVPSNRRVKSGDWVVSSSTRRVFLLDSQQPKSVVPAEGSRLTLLNCGSLDSTGAAQGLTYVFANGRWNADLPRLPALSSPKDPQPFVSVSRGSAPVQELREDSGVYRRVTATQDTDWLVLARGFPDLPENSPVTIRAEIRCPDPGRCYAGFTGPAPVEKFTRAAGEWEMMVVTLRLPRSGRGLAAVGRRKSRAGDSFDVRVFDLLPGLFPSLDGSNK